MEHEPVASLGVDWDVVTAVFIHGAWVEEVLMQVVCKFEDISFHRSGDSDIVYETGTK